MMDFDLAPKHILEDEDRYRHWLRSISGQGALHDMFDAYPVVPTDDILPVTDAPVRSFGPPRV